MCSVLFPGRGVRESVFAQPDWPRVHTELAGVRQESWLRAHAAMFAFFGGSVPRLVPDNLKTGVISHAREGEGVLNDAYREMAAHYSAAVLPGRVRAPRDKASVENTVSHVATWVIAGLRHEQFTSLAQLRTRVYEQIDAYNGQPFQKRAGSRLSVFTTEELPLMQPLPAAPFEVSMWSYRRRVNKNAHVVWAKNFYSVPFSHIGSLVDLRVTGTMLEVYRADERLTSHLLLPVITVNQYQTNDADLPEGTQLAGLGPGPD